MQKNQLFVALLLAIVLVVIPVTMKGQSKQQITRYGNISASWDSVSANGITIARIMQINDATTGADTLFFAVNNDTTAGSKIFPVLKGEVLSLPGLSPRFVRRKSSGSNIPGRLIMY